jgi:nucleoside-diphosphate-sugar epimerase
MRLFVTGVSSFVGRELEARAAAAGIEVSGVDLAPPEGSRHARLDVNDPSLADAIPDGVDAVVHLAALSRDPDCRGKSYECFNANVMGTLAVERAARARKAKRIVFASSEWVYEGLPAGAPRSANTAIDAARIGGEYALSKFVSECNLRQIAAQGGTPATVLRLGIVYGPRLTNWSAVESLLDKVVRGEAISIGSRATARRFVHVADVADAFLAAAPRTGAFETLDVQGPALVTLGEVVACGAALVGRPATLTETDPGNPSVRAVDDSASRAAFGWAPRVDIQAGSRSVAEFWGML